VVTLPGTAAAICSLTLEYVEASTVYEDSKPGQQKLDVAATDLICASLALVSPKLTKAQDTALIDLYKAGVAALDKEGLVNSTQVATLDAAASALQ
jgi:hypothetical protein